MTDKPEELKELEKELEWQLELEKLLEEFDIPDEQCLALQISIEQFIRSTFGREVDEALGLLRKEYANQDNRFTAYPIYVQVQELVCIGVIGDGYSVSCPFGDGITKTEYIHPDIEGSFTDESKLIDVLDEHCFGEPKEYFESKVGGIECINVGYVWIPVEFFLTIKGAEEYMKANRHNHGELRTYVAHFERRNFEMRGLLEKVGFKVSD